MDIHEREDVIVAIDGLPLAEPVAVACIDLDGFAELNERIGQEAGTAVLAAFADTLERNTPDDAQLFRIGGDEWAVVFPGESAERALVLLEELRTHLSNGPIGDTDDVVRLSAGVAGRPPHGPTGDGLLRAADEALMTSKRMGRDRVTIYVEDKMVMKSNYYSRATLDRLARLSRATNRTEASLLREAADRLLADYADAF